MARDESRVSQENRLYLTNNYSIISKYSASIKGYFKDPILEDFVQNEIDRNTNTIRTRTALINRGYAARQMAVEWIVNRSLTLEKIDCVVILGSGFDTLSIRLRSAQCHWIEIDLPAVMDIKSKYIRSRMNINGNDVILSSVDVTSFMSLKLHLIGCDLRNQDLLLERLSTVLMNIHQTERTRVAVLNEVCLCYLERSEVKQIFDLLKRLFLQSASTMHYIGFEQNKPYVTSQFAYLMLSHFEQLNFPLKNFPTRSELLDLFKNQLNFNNMTISSMYQIFHNALLTNRLSCDQSEGERKEPFDEYEELDLYLSHYALVTGLVYLRPIHSGESPSGSSKGPDEPEEVLFGDLCNRLDMVQIDRQHVLDKELDEPIQRYAHASCVLEDNSERKVAIISGGFGKLAEAYDLSYHHRLDDCILVGWEGAGGVQTVQLFPECDNFEDISLSRMHGQICHIGDDLVFFDGGRRNPQKLAVADNGSFIACVNESSTSLKFLARMQTNNSLRWRHRTLKLQQNKLIQVGGISGAMAQKESPVGVWNLSSDKFGFVEVFVDQHQSSILDRHTFGMDLRDENTLLLFGGLMASGLTDHPVDAAHGVILLDLRSPNLSHRVNCTKQSYDSQVHFIDENQFFKIGGVSTTTGLPEDFVDLYDLRNDNKGLPVTREPWPSVPQERSMIFIPTKMTSVHFKQSREITTIGGGGNYFTFGTHYNQWHMKCKYA